MKKIDRTNEENINYQGLKMKIIHYNNSKDIDVQFENGYISKNKEYKKFKDRGIKNPYYPEVYGVGFTGEGKYKPRKNDKRMNREYDTWHSMLERCYSKKSYAKYLSYVDCSVCKEWHNFQNFAKWYEENYYEVNNERMDLDKDILIKGNKIYSPEACVFVPQRINSLFVNNKSKDESTLPKGVYLNKKLSKYSSYINIGNKKRIFLGLHNTPEEAFYVYKKEKESYIKQVANEYKDKIPTKLYNAMYNYKVEITD